MGYLCKAATQARSLALLPRLVTVCVRDGPRQLSSLPRQQNPRSPWQQDKTSVYKITSGLQSRKFSVMGGLKGAAELRHTPLPALVLGFEGENKTFFTDFSSLYLIIVSTVDCFKGLQGSLLGDYWW